RVRVSPVDRFFFQAEDGIRDFHVTGVQTCALPISSSPTTVATSWRRIATGRSAGTPRTPRRASWRGLAGWPRSPARGGSSFIERSEERRGGKEGRLPGWAYCES